MADKAVAATGFDFENLALQWLGRREGVKWWRAGRAGRDVLPAWMADMDFPVAEPVSEAISAAVARGDLGDPTWSNWMGSSPLAEPFARRMSELYGWQAPPGWVRNVSDLVQAI